MESKNSSTELINRTGIRNLSQQHKKVRLKENQTR